MKKIKTQQFIGRQLARLKAGQSLYSIIMITITAISVFSFAFQINIWIICILFPIALFGAFYIGYIMDKKNIVTADHIKTLEMYHRYLSVADIKVFEFGLLQIEAIFEWLKSMQEDKPLDDNILKRKWEEYFKRWSPQEEDK